MHMHKFRKTTLGVEHRMTTKRRVVMWLLVMAETIYIYGWRGALCGLEEAERGASGETRDTHINAVCEKKNTSSGISLLERYLDARISNS